MSEVKRTIHNPTGFPLETLEKSLTLFTVKNNWRMRDVIVHPHPTDKQRVISIGYSFDKKTVTVADESRDDWQREFDELPWRSHFVFD